MIMSNRKGMCPVCGRAVHLEIQYAKAETELGMYRICAHPMPKSTSECEGTGGEPIEFSQEGEDQ